MASIFIIKGKDYSFGTIIMISIQLFSSWLSLAEGSKREMGDPTEGFVVLPLTKSHMKVQWPYNLRKDERYSFEDGVHTLKVYSSDKPHTIDSHTSPRTEVRITGYDYSSGVWQFEGHGFVPSGTSGVCIMQVFGASGHATTLMLKVYSGDLTTNKIRILSDMYNRWFRLNVIHDVDAGQVMVYIDNSLVYHGADRGGNSHYFKFGVYAQDNESQFMESRWKGIKIFKK